ncbi:MAG: acetate--CoA ligase family protein, partial [Candidatus Dojkabacteria bacterium]
RIPSFRFPERAIRTMGKMWWWKNNVDLRSAYETTHSHSAGVLPEQDSIKQVIAKAKKEKRSVLNNFESNEILKGWGINTPPTADIKTLKEALQFTSEHGWPVVLKVSSSKILHKSDLGGVIVNINNRQKLQSSLKTMQERISKLDPEVRRHTKIQIQKQVTGGKEIIVGVKHDANFGPVMMFGAGGTLAEIIQDRNLKMLPINEHEATDLIEQSKIFKLLEGYRGEKPYDTTRLKKLLTQVSNLVQNFPDIADIEINPVIITYDNVWAVDGKIMLHEHTAE